jgi:hypothetical protein
MEMLKFFKEGQVYEVLLVTKSNVTPAGVVRKGERLSFKLFGGKSAAEIKEHPKASIQITNDVELMAKLALNFPVELELEEQGEYRWIRGLPGVYGTVEFREELHEDELGKTAVMKCSLIPEGEIEGELPPRPISRADSYLLEMAVNLTRLIAAVRNGRVLTAERLYREVIHDHEMYTRFGGSSETAERMLKLALDIFGQ